MSQSLDVENELDTHLYWRYLKHEWFEALCVKRQKEDKFIGTVALFVNYAFSSKQNCEIVMKSKTDETL